MYELSLYRNLENNWRNQGNIISAHVVYTMGSVSEKVFDMPYIMSEAYRSSIGHCSVSIGHWEHMMLILHDYCRTICPTFCPKTSDIDVKTSDMSGCPTVFQKHCHGYAYFLLT